MLPFPMMSSSGSGVASPIAWAAATLLLAGLAGCSSSSTPPPPPASVQVSVGPAGGTLTATGVTLQIPDGALSSTTTIGVTEDLGGALSGYQTFSPVFHFTPDGLVFSKPVTVSLSTSHATPAAAVYWSSAAGYTALPTTWDGVTASALIQHFSSGFVGSPEVADGGSDASETDATLEDAMPSDAAGAMLDATIGDAEAGGSEAGAIDGGDVVAISANISACALRSNGKVACWGEGTGGMMGNGTTSGSICPIRQTDASDDDCFPTPVSVSNLSGVTAVATGYYHNCALLSDGTVACWGSNQSGDLGASADAGPGGPVGPDDCAGNPCSTTPVAVSGLAGVVSVSAGNDGTCALLSGGTVECWGDDSYGQLGFLPDGASPMSLTPVAIPGLSGVTAIASGVLHNCALLSSGSVECWGMNADGELGNGTTTGPERCSGQPCSTSPVPVSGLTHVQAIAAGGLDTCALLAGGTVDCWGLGGSGDLGNGASVNSAIPVPVSGLTGVTAIAVGYYNACALLSGGTVACWGDNTYGALGNGVLAGPSTCGADYCSPSPVPVSNLSGATAIAVGAEFACALLSNGTVECWGDNQTGELGARSPIGPDQCTFFNAPTLGTESCSTTPLPVAL
jgi:alpha-tubulin suppressor-like RCC1 family protein